MYITFENGQKLEYLPEVASVLQWLLKRIYITVDPEIYPFRFYLDEIKIPNLGVKELELILNKLGTLPLGLLCYKDEQTDEWIIHVFDLKPFEKLVNEYTHLGSKLNSSSTDTVQAYIPKLFELTDHPTKIIYKGKNKEAGNKIQTTHGKTQPFAILWLAAEMYAKKKANNNLHNNEVRLSCKEIYETIADPKHCNQPPDWQFEENVSLQKDRLNDFKRNIRTKALFLGDELYVGVNTANNAAYLIFKVPS